MWERREYGWMPTGLAAALVAGLCLIAAPGAARAAAEGAAVDEPVPVETEPPAAAPEEEAPAEVQLDEALTFFRSLGVPDVEGLALVKITETIRFQPSGEGEAEEEEESFLAWQTGEEEDGWRILYLGVVPQRVARRYEKSTPEGTLLVERRLEAVPMDESLTTGPSLGGTSQPLVLAAQLHARGQGEAAENLLKPLLQQSGEMRAHWIKEAYAALARMLLWRAAVEHLAGDAQPGAEAWAAYRQRVAELAERFRAAPNVDERFRAAPNVDWVQITSALEETRPADAAAGAREETDEEEDFLGEEKQPPAVLQSLATAGPGPLSAQGLTRCAALARLDGWRRYLKPAVPAETHPARQIWRQGPDLLQELMAHFDDTEPTPYLLPTQNTFAHMWHFSAIDAAGRLLNRHVRQQQSPLNAGAYRPATRGDLARLAALLVTPMEGMRHWVLQRPHFANHLQNWLDNSGATADREAFLLAVLKQGAPWQVRLAVAELAAAAPEGEDPLAAVERLLAESDDHEINHMVVLQAAAQVDRERAVELGRQALERASGWEKGRLRALLMKLGDTEEEGKILAKVVKIFGRRDADAEPVPMEEMGEIYQSLASLPAAKVAEILTRSDELRPDGIVMLLGTRMQGPGGLEPPIRKVLDGLLQDRRVFAMLAVAEVRQLAASLLYASEKQNQEAMVRSMWQGGQTDAAFFDWLIEWARAQVAGEEAPPAPQAALAEGEAVAALLAEMEAAEDPAAPLRQAAAPVRAAVLERLQEQAAADEAAEMPLLEVLDPVCRTVTTAEVLGARENLAAVAKQVRALADQPLDGAALVKLKDAVAAAPAPVALVVRKGLDASGFRVRLYGIDPADLAPEMGMNPMQGDFMMMAQAGEQAALATSPEGAAPEGGFHLSQDPEATVAKILEGFDAQQPWESFSLSVAKLR